MLYVLDKYRLIVYGLLCCDDDLPDRRASLGYRQMSVEDFKERFLLSRTVSNRVCCIRGTMMNTSPILTLKNIDMVFGVQALKNVNIDVMDGEISRIIGPNGAGKTTVFNVITGSITPTNGQVLYKGENIVGKRVDQICHLGISRTFQNIRLFSSDERV